MSGVSLAPNAMLIGEAIPKVTLGLGTESGFELLRKRVPAGYAERNPNVNACGEK
jgi:hypothetical protein